MRKRYTWILCLLLCWGSACTIQEEIHFNKNDSGKFTFLVDFSNVQTMMAGLQESLDSTSIGDEEQDLSTPPDFSESMEQELKGLDGIHNLKAESEKSGQFALSFEFDDIDALNRAYNRLHSLDQAANFPGMPGMDNGGFTPGAPPKDTTEVNEQEPDPEDFTFFRREGKYLIFRQRRPDLEGGEKQEMPMDMSMLQGMGDIIKVETIFSFDRKIKGIDIKNMQASQNDNSVKMTMGIKDLTNSSQDTPELKIKLK